MSLQIGSHLISPGLALAPMAGVTGYPFRVLVREQGCRLLFSEMISAKGLLHGGTRREGLFYFTPAERPLGLQLFGSDPAVVAAAAARLQSLGADFVDLNLGCPTPKIVRNGDGGALLCRPGLCSKLFRAVVSAVDCPVTVKMRTGWDEGSINAPEIAGRAEEAGIAAITVHGRTVKQGYSGRADWSVIGKVKAGVKIPVIGNGDVDSPAAAAALLEVTGCDGVMIGRAARGNPWIFGAVLAGLEKRSLPAGPTVPEIAATALRHFVLLASHRGEAAAAREMRRHLAWYVRGLPGSAAFRRRLVRVSSYEEAAAILQEMVKFAS